MVNPLAHRRQRPGLEGGRVTQNRETPKPMHPAVQTDLLEMLTIGFLFFTLALMSVVVAGLR
jgi:hypothetical protein